MAEMTTQVFFVAGQARNVLLAPISALQGIPDGDRQSAHVVAQNGKIEPREIRTGISDRLQVEILDGLTEGDVVVTAGQLKLHDGSSVQALAPVAAANGRVAGQ